MLDGIQPHIDRSANVVGHAIPPLNREVPPASALNRRTGSPYFLNSHNRCSPSTQCMGQTLLFAAYRADKIPDKAETAMTGRGGLIGKVIRTRGYCRSNSMWIILYSLPLFGSIVNMSIVRVFWPVTVSIWRMTVGFLVTGQL